MRGLEHKVCAYNFHYILPDCFLNGYIVLELCLSILYDIFHFPTPLAAFNVISQIFSELIASALRDSTSKNHSNYRDIAAWAQGHPGCIQILALTMKNLCNVLFLIPNL